MTILFVLVGAILILLVLSLLLQKGPLGSTALPRKVLHIGAISICGFSVYLSDQHEGILWAAVLALPAIGAAVWAGLLRDPVTRRRSWGMLYFALVFVILLWFFGESRPEWVFYPMLVLALADGLATVAGQHFALRHYHCGGDQRSYLGSAVFFIAALMVLGMAHHLLPDGALQQGYSWPYLCFIAIFLTVTEASSSAGRDNLWLPLATVYWLVVGMDIYIHHLVVPIAISLTVLAYLAYRRQWLNAGGAVTAGLMGVVLLVSPAPEFILPALAFFLVGTLLTRLPSGKNAEENPDKHGRSKAQVLSNGAAPILALMCYYLSGEVAWLFGFFAGFAAALSDTASSEIGTRLAHRSYAIIGFKPLKAGVSGGISMQGTIAGLLSATLVPAIGLGLGVMSQSIFVLISFIAFSANVLDSLLGQFIQRKRMLGESLWIDATDHSKGNNFKGLRWVNNDAVNAICTATATLAAVLLAWILG